YGFTCGKHAIIEFDDPISNMVIAIIMTNDDYRLPLLLQFGADLVIKNVTEKSVLICRPFVEQVDGPVLKECGEQRQPLPLSLGQIDRRECSVLNADFAVKLQFDQVVPR